ncbi:hypothetical protein MA16_Dca017964 [Dendrobium catenatum]|uniref:Uncharacterized protein n=1 Tax=Dendrobium catenatum TaxID=906689 RepID=A0A2I0X9G8_9ASPA|nr:hypothetical protein MA16_Dca017964 [Dendrobium catenatum]
MNLDDLSFLYMASFYVEASLLLNYVAAFGLWDVAFETWEYLCRVVAFGLT